MAKFLFYDNKIINILLQKEKPSGGAAVQAYGWIRGLKESGHDVQVFTSPPISSPLKEGCKDLELTPLYDRNKGIKWLRWIYYRLPYIYSKIKISKPEYLYQGIPSWESTILGIICYKLGIKFILRISNDYLLDNRLYSKNSRLHGFFLNVGIKLSYCVLCQNDYQYRLIRKRFPHKLALKISNPIYIESPVRIMNKKANNYIAWLGLFQYQKNIPLLYDIACALRNEKIVIAGKQDSSCDAITITYLERLKLLPNVMFIGFLEREKVLPFLADAKYLLNTSLYEGFSNTFLEAMAVGTPIITSCKVNPDNIISKRNLGIVYESVSDLQLKFASVTLTNYAEMKTDVLEYVRDNHDYISLSKKLFHFLKTKNELITSDVAFISQETI